jgi:hypothetical protein
MPRHFAGRHPLLTRGTQDDVLVDAAPDKSRVLVLNKIGSARQF